MLIVGMKKRVYVKFIRRLSDGASQKLTINGFMWRFHNLIDNRWISLWRWRFSVKR